VEEGGDDIRPIEDSAEVNRSDASGPFRGPERQARNNFPYVGQCPGNEGRANGTRLPKITDDFICKRSFGEFRASSHEM
jgi:hypothetical protein